jgi:G3E family GTPase
VLINEFGEVGLDHLAVEALHDDVVRSQPTLGKPE